MKNHVSLVLKLAEAKNLFYHLQDSPVYVNARFPAVNRAKVKLGRQIEKADQINSTLRPVAPNGAPPNMK